MTAAEVERPVRFRPFNPTFGYVCRRLFAGLQTLAFVIALNFFLIRLVPGDTIDALLPEGFGSDQQLRAELTAKLGLDRPIWVQFADYLWSLAHLDFGFSYHYSKPVFDVVLDRLGPTALLMVAAIVFALAIGVFLGAVAAGKLHKHTDSVILFVAMLFYATPGFWLGLMLVVIFSVQLGWLPTSGYRTVGGSFSVLGSALDVGRHLILPALTLGVHYLAIYVRLMRTSMVDVLEMDFIRTARAKGASQPRVIYRHALRNAFLPVLTMLGLQIGGLLGGAVVVETIFSWPGLGRLTYDAVLQRDYNLLLAILFASVTLVVVANVVIDLLYSWVDPRIQLR